MPHPRRVYCREWKPKARAIRGTVSLPRLQLISDARPYFECPTCFLFNDKVPVCLWCKSTSQESSTAFWASMPKQRTVSAPMKINRILDVKVASSSPPPARTRSAEVFYKPSTKPAKPVKPIKPTKPASPPQSRTSSRISSLTDKSNTYVSGSQHTVTMDGSGSGDDVKPAAGDSMAEEPGEQPPQGEGKFHTLPLRRKGHILRTTAGVMVHKSSRLSALFRKDAVPMLDKLPSPQPQPPQPPLPLPSQSPPPPPPPLEPKQKPRRSIAESTKTVAAAAATMRARRPKRTAPQAPALPTIPSSAPLDIGRRPSMSMSTSTTTTSMTSAGAPITSYTMPTPPSFLSPFWYRPEEFGRLPSSSSPPPAPAPGASYASASLDIPRPPLPLPPPLPPLRNMHAHSRSEPSARPPPASEARSQAWKRRMSGFIRHSVSVVVGHKAFH